MERPEDFKLKLIFLPLERGRGVKNGYWLVGEERWGVLTLEAVLISN